MKKIFRKKLLAAFILTKLFKDNLRAKKTFLKKLGIHIARLRAGKGMSQAELARLVIKILKALTV